MNNTGVVLGIDGGGTKTVALIAAQNDATVLGRGVAGSCNYQAVGAQAMFAALQVSIDAACAQAGILRNQITAACLGMAGADRAEDRALLNAWAAQALPGTQLQLVNDAALLLAAGTPNGWGLALISGTGSIAYGTAPDGVIARAGGWGYLFGDEGSGYAIGVAALRAVAQATDGRATATLLTQAVLTHWSLPHATALISHVYRGSVTRAEIAALARLVDSAATEGDAVADAILRNAAYALALAAATVCERIALPGPTPCALAGGVLLGSRNLRAHLESALQVYALGIAPLALVAEPALGALKLASRNVR